MEGSGMDLEGLMLMNNLSQGSCYPSQDSNQGSSEYKLPREPGQCQLESVYDVNQFIEILQHKCCQHPPPSHHLKYMNQEKEHNSFYVFV